MAHYHAIIEETDTYLEELRKWNYEFERDILNESALDPRTGNVVAEKLLRFADDKLRARDTLMDKLRLKNSALKISKRKLQLQLKQKEEMGEVLHKVDFQQLRIENKQYMEKIEERNTELLRLKMSAGNTLQRLNALKQELNQLIKENTGLENDIQSSKKLQNKISKESISVETEHASHIRVHEELKTMMESFRVPAVMDYVADKARLFELEKSLHNWNRKVSVAEMKLKRHKQTWKNAQKEARMDEEHGRRMLAGMIME
eukprot:UC4_evm3s832